MTALTGHRVESIRVELLTRTERSLGDLDGIEGGKVSWNANADLPGSGSLSLTELGQDINVSSDRVRIWWSVEGYGEWPLGVWLLAAPTVDYTEDGTSRELSLIDKLTIPRDDCLTETLQLPAGTNLVGAMVAQVQATGETRIAATASDKTLTNPLTWDPGTSRLTVINDLAAAAGYWSLWTDSAGQFRIEPYIAPASRPVVREFVEGETAIHTPDWSYTLPLWDATNMVVMTSQADDDGVFWTASAVDDNPDSPTSTVSMGRVLNPIVEENVEAASQADLQAQANRKLLNNSNVVGSLSVTHAPIPIWFNEAVRFVSQGVSLTATVTQMSLDLEPGSLVAATWRQAS